MAFRTKGVIRITADGDANFGLTTATEFDGKVSAKAITEQTDGSSSDVTGADEVLIYDQTTTGLLRVTVDEFTTGAGIATLPDISTTGDLTIAAGSGSSVSITPQVYLGESINIDPTSTVHSLGIHYAEEGIRLGEVGGLSPDFADIKTSSSDTILDIQLNENLDTFRILGKPDFNPATILLQIDGDTELATFSGSVSAGSSITATGTIYANGTGNSLLVDDTLRIAQSGSGLRMTNVGAFDNDGSDNFRVYGTNDIYVRANGETGAGLSIDATNQDVTIDNNLRMGSTTGPIWTTGSGTPEGSVTAPIGSLYTRTDGGSGTTLYVKESGTGNTGWTAK